MRIPGWLFVVLVSVVILAASGAAVLTVRWFGPVGGGAQSLASKNLEEQGIHLEQGPLYELGTFVVNLSSERGPGNFLRTAVVLQMDDEKAVNALDERKPAARDSDRSGRVQRAGGRVRAARPMRHWIARRTIAPATAMHPAMICGVVTGSP